MHKPFAFFLVLLVACNQPSKDNTVSIDTAPTRGTAMDDTLPPADTTPPQPAVRAPEGIYRVLLPGGVEHTLAFYPGHRYRLEEHQSRKSPTQTSGEWAPSNGSIWLYQEGVVVGKYRWQDDTLLYLLDGREHKLERLQSAMDNDVWRNKQNEGLEFFGVGNEPFWNIAIDEEKAIAFHLAEWTRPLSFPPARPVAAGDSIQYHTANDSATLRVVIYQRFCNDGMSDYSYDQQVKVVYNSQVYQGCGLLFK
jgi:uncharacterized membrane protein